MYGFSLGYTFTFTFDSIILLPRKRKTAMEHTFCKAYKYYTMNVMAIKAKQYTLNRKLEQLLRRKNGERNYTHSI